MSAKKWFSNLKYEKLEIRQYKSASELSILKQVTIHDKIFIEGLQRRIENLPTAGDEMTKMGPQAAYLVIDFIAGDSRQVIEFYNRSIKTPSTSFLSTEAELASEKEIWGEIESLLQPPELGSANPRVVGLPQVFKNFTIEYLGHEDRTPKNTTASSYVDIFEVTSGRPPAKQKIEMRSGQLPARDVEFEVEGKIYVLSFFSGKKDKPMRKNSFIVFEKK